MPIVAPHARSCLHLNLDKFQRQRRVDPSTLTHSERAARLTLLQRPSSGGKVTGRTFGVDHRSPGRMCHARLCGDLCMLRQRLKTVTIGRVPAPASLAAARNA